MEGFSHHYLRTSQLEQRPNCSGRGSDLDIDKQLDLAGSYCVYVIIKALTEPPHFSWEGRYYNSKLSPSGRGPSGNPCQR